MPKTHFVIPRGDWRCGGDYYLEDYDEYVVPNMNARGRGERTSLQNPEGARCCLGSVQDQLGCPPDDSSCPNNWWREHNQTVEYLVDMTENGYGINSYLSATAMEINDDHNLSDAERETMLQELFQEHGLTIEFEGEYYYPHGAPNNV